MRGGDAAGEGARVVGAKRQRRAMFIARDIANDSQAPGGAACVGSLSLDGLKQLPVFIGHLESLEKLQVMMPVMYFCNSSFRSGRMRFCRPWTAKTT